LRERPLAGHGGVGWHTRPRWLAGALMSWREVMVDADLARVMAEGAQGLRAQADVEGGGGPPGRPLETGGTSALSVRRLVKPSPTTPVVAAGAHTVVVQAYVGHPGAAERAMHHETASYSIRRRRRETPSRPLEPASPGRSCRLSRSSRYWSRLRRLCEGTYVTKLRQRHRLRPSRAGPGWPAHVVPLRQAGDRQGHPSSELRVRAEARAVSGQREGLPHQVPGHPAYPPPA
jgi:hypothetical protein